MKKEWVPKKLNRFSLQREKARPPRMKCPRCEEDVIVLFDSPDEVKLETGKDKEFFYRKTRLAWAT